MNAQLIAMQPHQLQQSQRTCRPRRYRRSGSTKALKVAVFLCAIGATMVLSSPAHSLPLPPYSPPLYTPLLLQNMASQGWVSRFYDPSTQMWTFYFTSSPDRETWELQSNHFGINI